MSCRGSSVERWRRSWRLVSSSTACMGQGVTAVAVTPWLFGWAHLESVSALAFPGEGCMPGVLRTDGLGTLLAQSRVPLLLTVMSWRQQVLVTRGGVSLDRVGKGS